MLYKNERRCHRMTITDLLRSSHSSWPLRHLESAVSLLTKRRAISTLTSDLPCRRRVLAAIVSHVHCVLDAVVGLQSDASQVRRQPLRISARPRRQWSAQDQFVQVQKTQVTAEYRRVPLRIAESCCTLL